MNNKMKGLLVGSLLLNILLIGIIGGNFAQNYSKPRGAEIVEAVRKSSIPAEDRAALQRKVEAFFESDDAARLDARQRREDALTMLEASAFDKEVYLQKVKENFALRNQERVKMAETIADIAEQMNQAERKELAQILRDPQRKPAAVK